MCKVSVIIPVYNVERFLKRCLDSVFAAIDFAQKNDSSFRCEVICVNDGSTDGSLEILRAYGSRIRCLSQTNQGQAAARNRGLDLADGNYITFVDSDDWIPRETFSLFTRVARESNAEIVASARYLKDTIPDRCQFVGEWKWKSPALKKMVSDRHLRSCVFNKLYRSEILRDVRFIEGIYFEDWPFLTEVFAKVRSFALVRAPLYVYCTNAGSESTIHSQFTLRKVNDYLTGIRHVLKTFDGTENIPLARRRAGLAASMMISKVWKCRDPNARMEMVAAIVPILEHFPPLKKNLPLKARYRWWRLSR